MESVPWGAYPDRFHHRYACCPRGRRFGRDVYAILIGVAIDVVGVIDVCTVAMFTYPPAARVSCSTAFHIILLLRWSARDDSAEVPMGNVRLSQLMLELQDASIALLQLRLSV